MLSTFRAFSAKPLLPRQALTAKAWSQNQPLTEERREDWYAAAAKIKCKPRLYTSGSRTAQQHFVGSNSLKERWGLPLLLEPPKGGRKNVECGMQKTEAAPEASLPQRLKPTSSDRHRSAPRVPPEQHRLASRPTHSRRLAAQSLPGCPSHLRVPTQVVHFQSLTRPASECPRPLAVPPPVHCRRQVQSAMYNGSVLSVTSPRQPRYEWPAFRPGKLEIAVQNSALPGVRANGITSRIFGTPVRNINSRSNPRPNPACGTVP